MDGIGEVDTHYRLLTMGPVVVLVVARVAVARRPIQGHKQYQSYSLDIVVIANGLPAKYGLHFCGKGRRIDRRYYKTRMRATTMDSNATLYKVIRATGKSRMLCVQALRIRWDQSSPDRWCKAEH